MNESSIENIIPEVNNLFSTVQNYMVVGFIIIFSMLFLGCYLSYRKNKKAKDNNNENEEKTTNALLVIIAIIVFIIIIVLGLVFSDQLLNFIDQHIHTH